MHIALALHLPLAPDETYYWEWSRNLSWGYYDQGPLIAWWIRAFCAVAGDTALGIRIGVIVAGLATRALIWRLADELYGPRAALIALVLSSVTPLSLIGSIIATYDPVMALFWAAACLFAARAVRTGSPSAWLALGLAFGLGLLAKHTMALFAVGFVAYLLLRPERRMWLGRKEPWLAAALGLSLFAPNLVWQSQHHWMTFEHITHLTGRGDGGPLKLAGQFVGGQALLLTPILFVAMVYALGWATRRAAKPDGDAEAFVVCMALPTLVLFFLASFRSTVQGNWPAAGWLTPPIAYAAWLTSRRGPRPPDSSGAAAAPIDGRWANWTLRAGIALSLFVCIAAAVPELRPVLHIHLAKKADHMRVLFGGPELAAAVDRERKALEARTHRPVAVGAATYDTVSRLSFYLPGQPRAYCFFLNTRANSYLLFNERNRLAPGADAIVADDQPPGDPRLPHFADIFARVEPVATPVPILRPDMYPEPARVYYLYRCYGYRPGQPAERPADEGGLAAKR